MLEEYASTVDTIGVDEIRKVVGDVIATMKSESQTLNLGTVLKALMGHGGQFEGKPVEKGEVSRIVKELL